MDLDLSYFKFIDLKVTMEGFCVATSNDEKFEMVKEVFEGSEIDREQPEIDEIQSMDAVKVAEDKARKAYEKVGKPVVVDDFSFYFDGAGKFPGPLIKHLLKETGVEGLKAMDSISSGCRTCCTVAFHDGEKTVSAQGTMEGRLDFKNADESAGMILMTAFVPEGHSKPLGELELEHHRHKAFKNLKTKLEGK